jgi:hypothetical protein
MRNERERTTTMPLLLLPGASGFSRRCNISPSVLLGVILVLAVLQVVVFHATMNTSSITTTSGGNAGPPSRLSGSGTVQHANTTTSTTATRAHQAGQRPPLKLRQGPIFYNLFVPKNDTATITRNTQRIVKEQLLQRDWTCPNATIHYTLIGDDSSFQEFVASHCRPTRNHCRLEEHLATGNEVHTLQRLWEYCRAIPADDDPSTDWLVTYIHDKGSYHASESNEKARRMATKAALDCRNVMPSSAQAAPNHNPRACNICMGAFHVFPQYLASAK